MVMITVFTKEKIKRDGRTDLQTFVTRPRVASRYSVQIFT